MYFCRPKVQKNETMQDWNSVFPVGGLFADVAVGIVS